METSNLQSMNDHSCLTLTRPKLQVAKKLFLTQSSLQNGKIQFVFHKTSNFENVNKE